MLSLLFFISIQLVSESFPVSSSGHVAVAICLFFSKKSAEYSSLSALLSLPELVLWMHIPTILVVAFFFIKEWWFLLIHLRRTWRLVGKLIGYMLCSNTVTAIFYILMRWYDLMIPLWIGFGITAVLLLSLSVCACNNCATLTAKRALLLGVVQGLALLPGISRFAAVFVTSRWMGIDARRSFSISWMLQWPLGVGMTLLSGYQYMMHPTHWVPGDPLSFMIIGGASLLSFAGLYAMYLLAQRGKLGSMAIYMIIPITLSLLYCR
jgi:undecaprenyl-diphosphatase